tara:strand:+ start:491 stop:1075 length:585 start_codon:yes stop_codon:yes gene_type:complete
MENHQMSEDVKQAESTVAEDSVKEPAQEETTNQGVKVNSDSVPYQRFSEVNARRKEAEAKLDAFKSKAEAKRKAELEKQGEYKALLDESKTEMDRLEAKAKQWEAYESQKREQLIQAVELTESQQKIASKLDLIELESYVEDLTTNKTKQPIKTDASIPASGMPNLADNPFEQPDQKGGFTSKWDAIIAKYQNK